jgi:hypothetical protein
MCSNPDCQALTVGPAEDEQRSISVGEAAHIYGARPGSARYDDAMLDADRSDIINAIWLCRNCHKMADSDQSQFTAALLYEWRNAHERSTMERLGKTGDLLKARVAEKRLIGFENASYLARQIVIDRPPYWEYKLTAELLRQSLEPVKRQWDDLQKGLYALRAHPIELADFGTWFQLRLRDLMSQAEALGGLLNGEMQASWGPPGQPGSETDILRVCSLFGQVCRRIIEWEETVRFAYVPSELEEVQRLFIGVGGMNIDKVATLPGWMSSIFNSENPSGMHEFRLEFETPDDWVPKIKAAFERGVREITGAGE